MIASNGNQPSLLLDWKQERPAAVGGRGRQHDIAQPIGAMVERPFDDGARVGLVDANFGFLWLGQGKLLKQLQCQAAAARGFDHQVSFERDCRAVFGIVTDRLYPRSIVRCDKLGHTGMHGQVYVRGLSNAFAGNRLEQWARHTEDVEAEITYRKWIVSGALEPNIFPGADLDRTGFCQIVLKSRKQGLQGLQSAREQHMGMLRLRRATSGRWLVGKNITLKNCHFPEMPRERLSGGKAGHTGANDNGMTSCKMWHVCLLKKIIEIGSKMGSGRGGRCNLQAQRKEYLILWKAKAPNIRKRYGPADRRRLP